MARLRRRACRWSFGQTNQTAAKAMPYKIMLAYLLLWRIAAGDGNPIVIPKSNLQLKQSIPIDAHV